MQGPTGSAGSDGTQWFVSDNAPTGSFNVGDFWIDVNTSANTCVVKVRDSAGWNASEVIDSAICLTGAKGDTGDRGAPGSRGFPGKTGQTGAAGAAGVAGVDGVDGAAGVDGIRGGKGFPGQTGATGATDATGVRGTHWFLQADAPVAADAPDTTLRTGDLWTDTSTGGDCGKVSKYSTSTWAVVNGFVIDAMCS